MIIKCLSWSDAVEQANRLRTAYKGSDWVVETQPPLFVGDSWRVVVS